ncbi:DUF898 family protein [Aliigemmobacter aestuarii]|uniref:DUF898 family protein n=1 Tax=Aliigemmobacter aestuarii TaxID=1445661 RepID=A0A4V3V0T8_9RHOB|nr:DUF898 family protein [Gemmobacter aestuarii]THD85262.1 DUF898 family protein [Gemmobacter aestuarii]
MIETGSFEKATYAGKGGPLFRLALATNLLTVLTLGIYRFWGKTRIRRFIWSATRFQGDAFEYTGTGLEKFLGFLVAMVFLAVYLGIVNLLLFFAGIRFVLEPTTEAELTMQSTVIFVSFLALLPWMFFAEYRSRRYKLARTRFRGIRFGMESQALGYVLRALGHTLLTTVTLGLLLPRQTFGLAKYMTDRSYYGDARFVQSGRWTALYGAMKHVFIGAVIVIAAIVMTFVMAGMNPSDPAGMTPWAILPVVFGYVWLLIGFVYYRVQSFAYLMSNTTLEGEVLFASNPSLKTILTKVIVGTILLVIAAAVVLLGYGLIVAGLFASLGEGAEDIGIVRLVIIAGLYLLLLAALSAGALALITHPVIAHIVATSSVANAEALSRVRQRAFDKGADADGFADALDIGGAI